MKTCTKCGETKPLDDFYRNRAKADGRIARCRECAAEDKRRWREENIDKDRERQRRWREGNRDKLREYDRRFYEKNRDKELERRRRYYEENRVKDRERQRRYREENRDKLREYDRRYREENRDKVLERKRRYYEENRDYVLSTFRSNNSESQAMSVEMATVPLRTPWTAEEDAFLMANNGMTVFQKAIHLGRTYRSCEGRRHRLRQAVSA